MEHPGTWALPAREIKNELLKYTRGTWMLMLHRISHHGLHGSRRQSGSYRQGGKTIDLIEKKPDHLDIRYRKKEKVKTKEKRVDTSVLFQPFV